MAKYCKELYVCTRILYKNLVENIDKLYVNSLFFAPIRDFKALVDETSIDDDFCLDFEVDENGNKYINIRKEQALKFYNIDLDGNVVLKLVAEDYVIKEDDIIKSNYYNAIEKKENICSSMFMNFYSLFGSKPVPKAYSVKVILSPAEYELYLFMLDNYLVLKFIYSNTILGFAKESDKLLSYDFGKEREYMGLHSYYIVRPLMELFIYFDNEIIKSFRFAIEDVLNELKNIDSNLSEERVLYTIKKAGDYFKSLLVSAGTVMGGKVEYKITTAADVITKNKISNSKDGECHKYSENSGWEQDSNDKFLEKLKFRTEINDTFTNS